MQLLRSTPLLLLLLAACETDPGYYVREAQQLQGECGEEGLKRADEECVQAMERGIGRVQEMMETYTGALHSLERALERNPPVLFDTTLATAVRVDSARVGDGGRWADQRWGSSGGGYPDSPVRGETLDPGGYADPPRELGGPPRHADPSREPARRAVPREWDAYRERDPRDAERDPSRSAPRRAYEELLGQREARYEELLRRRIGDLPPDRRNEEWGHGKDPWGRRADPLDRETDRWHRPGEPRRDLECDRVARRLDRIESSYQRLSAEDLREVDRLRSELAMRCPEGWGGRGPGGGF